MVYIKKLVLKGFKSFARETIIEFSNSMNVIVGPNGSGKSNITDAICFVLGRMSIKSLRAKKSKNLIFAGTKQYKPASESSVKLVLDNSDKIFSLPQQEITIERIVRKKGTSIYRINNQTKTRQEVLELLNQGGIDPYGFNITLQGEISSTVKMHGEERRKVIEEVAGISIYELRKEKSLKELEKTDERLKEVQTTLRERTSYLKNLEEEKRQALRYKKLEQDIKKYKASIIKRKLKEKQKQLETINNQEQGKLKEREKERRKQTEIREKIENNELEIKKINSSIQTSSGIQQEKLNREISDLRADLAGLNVRQDNNQEKLEEISSRKSKTKQEINNLKTEIETMRKEFPSQAKKHQSLDEKKSELEQAEKDRKIYYNLRGKLETIKEKLNDKHIQLQKTSNQESVILKLINNLSENLTYTDIKTCNNDLEKLNQEQESLKKHLETIQKSKQENEKLTLVYTTQISDLGDIKSQVSKLEICPLCKSNITESHIKDVFKESDEKISSLQEKLEKSKNIIEDNGKKINNIKLKLNSIQKQIDKAKTDLFKLHDVENKNQEIKSFIQQKRELQEQIQELEKQKKTFENRLIKIKDVEERYDKLFLELQEISSRTEENLDAELEFKQRSLTNSGNIIKQLNREEQELNQELEEINKDIEDSEQNLEEKELEERELEKKFQKLIDKRTNIEKQVHENNTSLLKIQNNITNQDTEINNIKIEIAEIKTKKENLEIDFEPFKTTEILSLPVYALEDKLNKTQAILDNIGSVNLRALEVYDKIKEEYDAIAEKVEILEKEKLEVMKIIDEIDKKKKKTFMKTLKAVNELFNRNFSQLYTKGEAFLELENREDMFSGGLDIVIKVGKGKYFDVTSLSGGEQTLVALSLIFAIQEYKPYAFYIFDEVDAALDKRNSERLASLVKKYMKAGQYIIVTHNDAIITESSLLYGVSMQEGISKIISLEI